MSKPIPIFHQGRARNCGPYATAMALSFYLKSPVDPLEVAQAMRGCRVPLVGATFPCGPHTAVRAWGFGARTGYLGKLHDLKHHILCDRPVIVLVRPTDLPGHRPYDLHYRVLVGFRDDDSKPGGGELYFNCSSSSSEVSPAESAPTPSHPGNVTLSYESFLSQWIVAGLFTWYLAVTPRGT
ncbi:MAG: C39 family peptidase [Chloroflexota bacterium]